MVMLVLLGFHQWVFVVPWFSPSCTSLLFSSLNLSIPYLYLEFVFLFYILDVKVSWFKWEDQAPRYPGLGLDFPRDGETYILSAKIDFGLFFLICRDLKELRGFYKHGGGTQLCVFFV